jgi:hypothetical protein
MCLIHKQIQYINGVFYELSLIFYVLDRSFHMLLKELFVQTQDA